MANYIRKITLKKSCKYGEYGSFEHLLSLIVFSLIHWLPLRHLQKPVHCWLCRYPEAVRGDPAEDGLHPRGPVPDQAAGRPVLGRAVPQHWHRPHEYRQEEIPCCACLTERQQLLAACVCGGRKGLLSEDYLKLVCCWDMDCWLAAASSFYFRWHHSALDGAYMLCPISGQSPEGRLRSSINVCFHKDHSQPQRVECSPLSFSTPLSFRQAVPCCSGLSLFRKFFKPLSTSTLPSCYRDWQFCSHELCESDVWMRASTWLWKYCD